MIPTVFGGARGAPPLRLVWKGFLESLYTSDPPIDGRVRLQIRVVNHAFDVFGVHFYNKVSDSKDEYPDCSERAE